MPYYKRLAKLLVLSAILTGIIDVFVERTLSDVVSYALARDGLSGSLSYISLLAIVKLSHGIHAHDLSRSWKVAILWLVYSTGVADFTRLVLRMFGLI